MLNRSRLLASAAAAGLAAVVVHAGPAAAESGRTFTGTFPVDEHVEVLDPESTICGFPISWDVTGEGRYQVFLDGAGDLLRSHVVGVTSGTLSANGINLTVRTSRVDLRDFTAGTLTQVGVVFRYQLPGTGVVLSDRGLIQFAMDPETGEVMWEDPLVETGQHPFFYGDVGELCEVLTP